MEATKNNNVFGNLYMQFDWNLLVFFVNTIIKNIKFAVVNDTVWVERTIFKHWTDSN